MVKGENERVLKMSLNIAALQPTQDTMVHGMI